MGDWLQRNIVEPGKLPLLLALTAFVLTFLITRVITRLIRAGKGLGVTATGGVARGASAANAAPTVPWASSGRPEPISGWRRRVRMASRTRRESS